MPLNKYFDGKGASVMKKMVSKYGAERGKEVFYATANKLKKKKKGKMKAHLLKMKQRGQVT